jgi:hypothetical protein
MYQLELTPNSYEMIIRIYFLEPYFPPFAEQVLLSAQALNLAKGVMAAFPNGNDLFRFEMVPPAGLHTLPFYSVPQTTFLS